MNTTVVTFQTVLGDHAVVTAVDGTSPTARNGEGGVVSELLGGGDTVQVGDGQGGDTTPVVEEVSAGSRRDVLMIAVQVALNGGRDAGDADLTSGTDDQPARGVVDKGRGGHRGRRGYVNGWTKTPEEECGGESERASEVTEEMT